MAAVVSFWRDVNRLVRPWHALAWMSAPAITIAVYQRDIWIAVFGVGIALAICYAAAISVVWPRRK